MEAVRHAKGRWALLLAWCLAPYVGLAACGEPEPVRPVGPLTPDLYEIADGDVPAPGSFLRYHPPSADGGGLDIAITDYEASPAHGDGERPPVSLVGVVHVADPLYFDVLQRVLDEDYAVVLYEAVKPADLPVVEWQRKAAEKASSVSAFQQELASWFGFVFQLTALDYDRSHFVHADMTTEAFREAGGDELLGAIDPGAAAGDLPEGVRGTLDAVRALGRLALSEPGPLRSIARRMFAETMGTTDIGTTLDMYPGLEELLLDKRNEVVMQRLAEVLPGTRGRVAIFYGAAHMPDLEHRLRALGYERTGGRWLRAWALRKPLVRCQAPCKE